MTSRNPAALLAVLSICLALPVGLAGCSDKDEPKLRAGEAAASFEAPDGLLTAVTISNAGAERADDVRITSLSVAGAKLTLPSTLPASLGRIAPDGRVVLDANFAGSAVKPDSEYTLTIVGTYSDDGRKSEFTLHQKVRTPPASPGSRKLLTGKAPVKHVKGALVPPQKPSFGNEVNENGHARPVPTGPNRPLVPSKKSSALAAPHGAGGNGSASIDFSTNDPVGINGNTIAEPSGASGGGVVFETANSYAAYSIDGGATFHRLNPTTIFPNGVDGGFCCDQIVQYVPSIDRFIWVMQYRATTSLPGGGALGPNLYRFAFASPADIISSNGTSWSYFDIASTDVLGSTSTSWLDYPDVSVGDTYLYLGADDVNNGGHVVMRISLSDIQSSGTINYGYTASADSAIAYGGHISQNTGDTAFWAGHNNNSSIRVFSMPEAGNTYGWTDVNIGSWPQTNTSNLMTTTVPDGQDFLAKLAGFPGNAVLGLARSSSQLKERSNQLYLAWTGAIGSGFAYPQVQWVALDINNNFAPISQQQVWNPGYAFAYPAFAVNTAGEIGMSLEWGGGGNYENHVAGFWGDYVVYITTHSDIGTSRFGDYVTIRRNTADPTKFDAFGYGLTASTPPGSTNSDVHYIVFSR